MAGGLALVGSGEFLASMRPVDAHLLAGRPQKAVFLPTAAGLEGPERVAYWLELGRRHYEAMGVEAVPLPVLDRAAAEDGALAAAVAGAGLVYLSGGNPGYLADTLAGTAVWAAILAAREQGAALAGCSAGACALSSVADDFRNPGRYSGRGLGVVPQVAVVPHYDRFARLVPELAGKLFAATPEGVALVGIDEETALVGGPERFQVMGRATVCLLGEGGAVLQRYRPGEEVELPAASHPAGPDRRQPR